MIGLVDGNNFFVSCERVFNRRLVGRPVAVISNNDGCCVSRSNEFKVLGIPMGTPSTPAMARARYSPLGLARSNREPRLRGGYAQGLGARSWHMKRQKLSRRPTTRRNELKTVR